MRSLVADIKEKEKIYRKPFCILTLIYTLAISAILRANFYYIDDLGRALWGYRSFECFSRYIPQYVTVLLHADTHLTDISPLPQLLAAAILAAASVITLRLITGRDTFTWIEYAAVFPIGLSPYFLECISYKFDAPYMALSVLASVAPLLFEKRGNIWYAVSVVLGMLVVCMSYQAASGIFPMLVAVLVLERWNQKENGKDILRFLGLSVASYFAGMMIFALGIMHPSDDYVSNSIGPLPDLFAHTWRNLKEYYYLVVTDFKKEWLVLIALVLIGFLYVTVRESKRKWYFALAVGAVTLTSLLVMAFGLYPLLTKTLFDPRAMYGFGVCLGFLSVYGVSHHHTDRKRYALVKIACFALSWCFFTFSLTYGNALSVQKTYTDFRMSAVIDDLDDMGLLEPGETRMAQITGTIGKAPALEGMRQDYQMLNRLVPILFRDSSWDWGRFTLEHYYSLNSLKWDTSFDFRDKNLPVVKDSIYHTIRADAEHVLIELKY